MAVPKIAAATQSAAGRCRGAPPPAPRSSSSNAASSPNAAPTAWIPRETSSPVRPSETPHMTEATAKSSIPSAPVARLPSARRAGIATRTAAASTTV
ncbi:unannotated protein [freshwater metagenome]|uniref:Unannotated protein n=1 Tax=freshwater metagenome TaxID=449393 RepID=A0A6J7KZ86_9ZZZZ